MKEKRKQQQQLKKNPTTTKNKDRKEQEGTEAMVKWSRPNDPVAHLSQALSS